MWRVKYRVASLLGLAGGLLATRLDAATPIPDAETQQPPAAVRLAEIHRAAQSEGWVAQAAPLRNAAQRAYERGQLGAASAWLHVYRWATLFGTTEDRFVPKWIQAVQDAQVAHPNMATQYPSRPLALGLIVAPDAQAWLTGHETFSSEFFAMVQPVDFMPAVLRSLSDLHQRDPKQFETYASLALAIALVYDVPPPPDWPHGQVPAAALVRKWPTPAQAFAWWIRENEAGRTYHRLNRLTADELKFVIDAAAPFDELEWSQQVANYPLSQLARAYTMIAYRRDRAANRRPMWPEKTYALPVILGAGGICVDQAYFATEVGKARGVPTLLFEGRGSDGRHAWFGYLDAGQKWQLDAGRYAEQRLVTGIARDPQTWRPISDHELRFLAERFRALPAFQQSRVQAEFAADYLERGEAAAAARAARKAVNYERRNDVAWETLLAAESALGLPAKQREGALYEAEQAFQRYPDLELAYATRLMDSLRARGETSAADMEQRRLVRKYQGDRNDLSLQQAREALLRSLAMEPPPQQMRTYYETLDRFGRGAGIAFFDQIVVVFVEHLLQQGRRPEALQAAERARAALKIENGSQLEQEFSGLLKALRTGR